MEIIYKRLEKFISVSSKSFRLNVWSTAIVHKENFPWQLCLFYAIVIPICTVDNFIYSNTNDV